MTDHGTATGSGGGWNPPAPGTHVPDARGTGGPEPTLPPAVTGPAPGGRTAGAPGGRAASRYRSDHERRRSVSRRANPLHRRIVRAVIALTLVVATGFGLLLGAREIQEYLDRDRLPAVGSEIPDIRATTFEVTASEPAPALAGTITIDVETGAFEFFADPAGADRGAEVVSPDGVTAYVRTGNAAWRRAADDDPLVTRIRQTLPYLRDVESPDDVLVDPLRDGYVELVERTTTGDGERRVTDYDLRLDTTAFGTDFPLQWTTLRDDVLPTLADGTDVAVTLRVDAEGVVVGLTDPDSNWSWRRLTYAAEPFRPLDPGPDIS